MTTQAKISEAELPTTATQTADHPRCESFSTRRIGQRRIVGAVGRISSQWHQFVLPGCAQRARLAPQHAQHAVATPGAFLRYTEYGGYYVEKRIHADVCRDSGSIAADFRLKDKSSLSWLLEVSSEGWPKYAHLHAGCAVQTTCDPNTIAAIARFLTRYFFVRKAATRAFACP